MVREGVPLELNEFDVYAVTAAIRLRDEHGGEVVTMTMGPPQGRGGAPGRRSRWAPTGPST